MAEEKKHKKGMTGLDWCKGWMPNKSEIRIIKANKKAKKMGKSYGQYMAGLWEENERVPIIQNDFEKYKRKAQAKKQPRVLEGVEAAEYVTALKVKAGTYREPQARYSGYNASGAEKEKAKLLNSKWSDACKVLRENPDKIKGVKLKSKSKKRGDSE